MADKSPVKINKKHKGKEFRSSFHFVGPVKPVRRKEEGSEDWNDVPYYEVKKTKTNKPRRVLQFVVETAKSNDLKIELAGMEQKFAYPYSMTDRASITVPWEDRNDKSKFPNETYHIINGTDWDRAEEIGKQIQTGQWVEVKGYYEFSSFEDAEGKERTSMKRIVEQFNPVEDGQEISLDRKTKIKYVTNFDSPDFIEVNRVGMQIAIRSTYQKEEKADTEVRATFLSNGSERSQPNDVDLIVYYQEVAEGKPLADAFASLNHLDFIEITGRDNNCATFTYIDVEDNLDDADPFNEVAKTDRVVRQERVVSGSKKGLEITGFVQGTIIRGFMSEEEMSKVLPGKNDPFDTQDSTSGDPFDPFA